MRMGSVGRAIFSSHVRERVLRDTVTPQLVRLGGTLQDCRVLEVGAGSGAGAQLLLEQFRARSVDALDLDPAMLCRAVARLGHRVPAVLADMSAMPFPSAAYDVVVGFGALHLADDWRGALREICRVLEPGGRYLFEQPINPLLPVALKRPGGGRVPGGFGRFELIDAMAHAGFVVERSARVGIGGLDLVGLATKR